MISLPEIYVNNIYARESIKRLEKYANSTQLTDIMTSINSILTKSSGETKDKLDEINNELTRIVNYFMETMGNTLDFMMKATYTFENMDRKLSKEFVK